MASYQLDSFAPKGRVDWSIRGQRGFTMIELLIAILILMIGVLGVMSLQRTVARGSGVSKHVGEATFIAETQMEQLRVMGPTELSDIEALPGSQRIEVVDEFGQTDANGFFTRTTTVTSVASQATITVDVTWREGAETDDRNITTTTIQSF